MLEEVVAVAVQDVPVYAILTVRSEPLTDMLPESGVKKKFDGLTL